MAKTQKSHLMHRVRLPTYRCYYELCNFDIQWSDNDAISSQFVGQKANTGIHRTVLESNMNIEMSKMAVSVTIRHKTITYGSPRFSLFHQTVIHITHMSYIETLFLSIIILSATAEYRNSHHLLQ